MLFLWNTKFLLNSFQFIKRNIFINEKREKEGRRESPDSYTDVSLSNSCALWFITCKASCSLPLQKPQPCNLNLLGKSGRCRGLELTVIVSTSWLQGILLWKEPEEVVKLHSIKRKCPHFIQSTDQQGDMISCNQGQQLARRHKIPLVFHNVHFAGHPTVSISTSKSIWCQILYLLQSKSSKESCCNSGLMCHLYREHSENCVPFMKQAMRHILACPALPDQALQLTSA